MTPAPNRWYLIRGLGREARHWFTFDTQLSNATGVPVVSLDLPGTGKQLATPCPLSVERIARDLDLSTPTAGSVGLVGISFGGMVALEAAHLRSRSVSHLVLINSSSRLSPTVDRLQPLGMLRFVQAVAERDPRRREELIYALTTTTSRERLEHYADHAARIAATAPVSRRTAVRQLLAAARYRPKPVLASCLLIAGAHDRVVHPACSAALASFLGGTFIMHPTGGHDLPVEDPEWIVARIRSWLSHEASEA